MSQLKPGEIIQLTIEKPVAGGRMIARADGQVVLVSGAIPGERVAARVERVAKGTAYAETTAVEEPSPDRREPSGDLLCGGCLLAHVAYPRQLQIKSAVIADAFARIGRLPLPDPVRVAPSREDGYRMRARLHVRGGRIGFFREGTHELCDPRATRQLLPETCDALERLENRLQRPPADMHDVELTENIDASERVVDIGRAIAAIEGFTPGPYVTDVWQAGSQSIKLRRHVLAFFQGNRYLLRDLVTHVLDRIPDDIALIDLYAGVGLFAIAAAARGARVWAVEGDRFAAADLRANVAASKAAVTPVHLPVEQFLANRAARLPARADLCVVVDPPRTGMSREALDGVIAVGAKRVIYVSCDVATLARDARKLVDAGYELAQIDAFDLFPNTPHVETVVVFARSVRAAG